MNYQKKDNRGVGKDDWGDYTVPLSAFGGARKPCKSNTSLKTIGTCLRTTRVPIRRAFHELPPATASCRRIVRPLRSSHRRRTSFSRRITRIMIRVDRTTRPSTDIGSKRRQITTPDYSEKNIGVVTTCAIN